MKTNELKKLTKAKLEELGRKFGLELDKRFTKAKLIETLEKHINGMTKAELESEGRKQGVELDKRKKKETLIKEVVSSGFVTERIHGKANFTWVDRQLSDKDGNVLKFSTSSLAKWHGHKRGGKPSAISDYFVVIKY